MASTCLGDCLNIKSDVDCVRPGTTYAKLYKWPVAEAEFLRSISHGGSQRRASVVDSISCRQMYLRSYTFSRNEENEDGREDQDQDGDDASNGRNERRRFEGGERKKAAKKKSIRTSKTMLHRAFMGKLVLKCLSCAFSY
ncbi:hypothetical protein EUTSA_v10002850mg [Eutrema salsugineum]|uniref:Uncharacterized protein n=1 Tax=Eutrema salsugineum TaxID=72664 RepID=V4L4Y7_EUTSA|nr:uncharacterized protein LOC18014080 [Eutrema salsugineum]ESQ37357.1 hypothetical protein EUTSA_v10002850mg [Eutrema salsugineum]